MMSTCQNCGCSPCACAPSSVINQPQIVGGVFDAPTINGPTINGGQSNNLNINGATIDCTTRVCTQPPGICDQSIASTAFVCAAIDNAISSANPSFCQAVDACIAADPTSICPSVQACINTTPGIINSTAAFGVGARATDTLFGVMRFATLNEVQNGACGVALEPCDLLSVWNTFNPVQPFWVSFCAAIGSCGYALLASPAFTGIPTAPTAAAGTNTTQIATTAFVATAIGAAISAANPAFCAAVSVCAGGGATCASISALFPAAGGNPPAATRFFGSDCLSYTAAQIVATGGGGGGGSCQVRANGRFQWDGINCTPIFALGSSQIGAGNVVAVTFFVAEPDTNYSVVLWPSAAFTPGLNPGFVIVKSTTGFNISASGLGADVDWAVLRSC